MPAEVRDSTDPSIVALIQARDMALSCDVHKRPSARDVANFLDEAYLKSKRERGITPPKAKRVEAQKGRKILMCTGKNDAVKG